MVRHACPPRYLLHHFHPRRLQNLPPGTVPSRQIFLYFLLTLLSILRNP